MIKSGAHFKYSSSYPADYQFQTEWMNHPYIAANEHRKEYLTAMNYKTTRFFNELNKLSSKERVVILYTSDHGQNLFDHPGLTHCSSSQPNPEEATVPLVVLSNFEIDSLREASLRNFDRLTHYEMIATLRNWLGYKEEGDQMGGLYTREKVEARVVMGSPFGLFGTEPNFFTIDREAYKRLEAERWGDGPEQQTEPPLPTNLHHSALPAAAEKVAPPRE